MKDILVSICLLLSSYTFALTPQGARNDGLKAKAQIVQKLLDAYAEVCINEKGAIRKGTIVATREAILGDGRSINCEEEGKRLGKVVEALKLEAQAKQKKLPVDLKGAPSPSDNACVLPLMGTTSLDKTGQKLVSDTEQILVASDAPVCPIKITKESVLQCTKEVGCNLLRSIPTMRLVGLSETVKKSPIYNSCLDSSKGDCLSEVINGIIVDISTNVEGFWTLAKLPFQMAKDLAISSWQSLTRVEDKTSQSALLASKLNNADLKEAEKDKPNFLVRLAQDIYSSIKDSIKKNFGCKKWEGQPHLSKCSEEMKEFECADCNQWNNMICGVAGVLGGEIISAYIAGAAINISKEAAAKAHAVLTAHFAVYQKATQAAGKVQVAVVKSVVLAVEMGIDAAMAVAESPVGKTLIDFSKNVSTPIVAGAIRLGQTKQFQVVLNSASKLNYFRYLDEAYEKGVTHSDMLLKSGQQKLSSVLRMADKIGDVDNLIVKADVDLAITKARLKEGKIAYEELTLSDGTKALKLNGPAACVVGGKPVLIK